MTTRPTRRHEPARRRRRTLGVVSVAITLGTLSLVGCSDADDTGTPTPTDDVSSTTTGDAGTSTTAPPVRGDELSAPLADPDATGRELAQRFLDILGEPDPAPLLEEFLSPAFQLQRSNGTFANKEEYVDQPASVARFTILDDGFRALQDGPTLTVRFRVTIEEEINGTDLRATDADRLGVFLRTSRGWQLLAWSNFNPVPQ